MDAQTGNTGPPPTVRLYGCADDLGQREDGSPVMGPDGIMDCDGDRLRFRPAWLASGQSAGLRAALGARDQRMDLTLGYAPTYWAPAAASDAAGQALQRPGIPEQGLFDDAPSGTAGRFDAAFVHDEANWPHLDNDDTPDPVDFDPHDGLPDRADRHDGTDPRADRYVPALTARVDLTWWDANGAQVSLPDGRSFLFTPIGPGTSNGPDAWAHDTAPTGVHWSARPFGHGGANDGQGALVTPTVTARIGDTLRFLDHQIVLVGLLGGGAEPAVVVDIQHLQGRTPVPIASGFVLNRSAEGHRPASISDPGISPWNAVTADGVQAARRIPNLGGTGGAWFAFVESVDPGANGAPPEVRLRLGRWISTEPAANAFLVARALHTIDQVNEADGALRTLVWTRVVPLGADLRLAAGLELRGHDALSALPVPAPFDRDHIALDDIRAHVARDPYGFLQGTTSAGVFGSSELRLDADARAPQERARRADPVEIVWHHRGDESRLGGLHRTSDDQIVRTLIAPFRYAAIGAPRAPALLHSALLDDEGLLLDADHAAASPRGARSFVVQADDVFAPYIDGGLRLYGGTLNRPGVADVVRLGQAWLPAEPTAGGPRHGGDPAGQAVELDARFLPYHSYGAAPPSPVPESDEERRPTLDDNDDRNLLDDHPDDGAWPDNLHDVRPEVPNATGGAAYGPALQMRYTYTLGTADGLPVAIPITNTTRIVLPMADRDPSVAGLDSMDADGDGVRDALIPARFWDRDSGTDVAAHWRTTGIFDPSRDLLDLQTPPLLLPSGGDVRLFDHGVRFTAAADGAGGTATFEILDLTRAWGGPDPAILAAASLADAPDAQCVVVTRAHEVHQHACGSLAPAGAEAPFSMEPGHAVWWVEVLDVGAASARVRLHRLVSAADSEALFVGGVRYTWTLEPEAAGGLERVGMVADLPLGGVMAAESLFGERRLVPHAPSRPVSVLPPFDLPYLRIERSGVSAQQDAHGFDLDTPFATAARTARLVGPLVVRTAGMGVADAHRFVHLDPTRMLDPSLAPGHAFVGAVFAAPAAGVDVSAWAAPVPHVLQVEGSDAFGGAIRSAGDRGWDRFVRLVLPAGQGPYRIETVRVGAVATSASAGGADPWRGAAAAPWLFDPAVPLDLYAADRPSPGPASITPSPATPTPESPTGSPTPTDGDGARRSPGVAFAVAVLVLVLLARVGTRHQR